MTVRVCQAFRRRGCRVAGLLALIALILGVPVARVSWIAGAVLLALIGLAAADYLATRRAWRASTPAMTRRLPAAFAIGVQQPVHLSRSTPSGAARVALRVCTITPIRRS